MPSSRLPYGSWPSPVSAHDVAASSPRIDGAAFVAGDIWWGVSVPEERGRMSVRSQNHGTVLPAPWSARSRVHEYGGGAWTADGDALYFVEASDQRIYRMTPPEPPVPLTAPGPRYGGLRLQHGHLLAVREDVRGESHRRGIADIPLDGSAAEDDDAVHLLVSGDGFFAHPALSPDGTMLAWVEWGTTQMPWDAATLRAGPVNALPFPERIGRAVVQPEWLDDETIVFADDSTGRWNLRRAEVSASGLGSASAFPPADADTGGALWVLGQRWFRLLSDSRIVAVETDGQDRVVVRSGTQVRPLPLPVRANASIEATSGDHVLVSGAGEDVGPGLWLADLASGAVIPVHGGTPKDAAWTPPARAFTVEGPRGPVHAFDYAPRHPDHPSGVSGERAPYVVFVHGGPTTHVAGTSSAAITYFTSRGIGVLDVNYAGSTGYGRAYRERLNGQWGIADVDDVLAAARGLVASGAADPDRIAIRGSSAGGWTVLCALVRGGVFSAGISRYGVGDLRMLAEDSPDFERHYLDVLVGPLPEAGQVYEDRSPLTHADRIDVPVLLLQGADDPVVLPSQSESLRDALATRGVPHEYLLFPGEGHGFRRAETIVTALEAELRFLGKAFGFTPSF